MPTRFTSGPRLFRFGPYEFETRTGELRNGGTRLKIGNHSAQILSMLLEHLGEVVFREDIQARLWADDTIVEFDWGINTAVRQLRAALNDSAEKPKYIETVSRRGYRFLAEVETVVPVVAVPVATPVPLPMWKCATAAILVLLAAGGILWWRASAALLTDQDVLVPADFTNTTGDTAFDGALRQALAFELEQSPFLKVMDDQVVNQALKLMNRSGDQPITSEIAGEVCVREAQKATIGGSIVSLGSAYQIVLQATNCQTGATLAREQAEAEDKEHVLKAVAKAATGMRAKLGESLASIQKDDRPRLDVTTPSLEALKDFRRGQDLNSQGLAREGIPYLQRAVELDPNFSAAYMFLGVVYNNTGQIPLSKEATANAFALIKHVSERERLFISGEYYRKVTQELDKAAEVLQMLVRSYPRFVGGHHLLGLTYSTRGEYEKALEQHRENARVEPRNVNFLDVLMQDYIALDRFDEAKAVAKRALADKLTATWFHQLLLRIAYLQDDHAAQETELQWFAGRAEEPQGLYEQFINAFVHGYRRKVKELSQRRFEMQRRVGNPNAQSPNLADVDSTLGDCESAGKGGANAVLCMDAPALQLAEEKLAKNPPPNPDTAALLFQRGRLAMNAGKGAEAAAEFQKIVDHKGRNWGPFYSIAHLFLARAEVMVGDTAKARRAYKDFLTLWKDADKDLPYYGQAHKELAELR